MAMRPAETRQGLCYAGRAACVGLLPALPWVRRIAEPFLGGGREQRGSGEVVAEVPGCRDPLVVRRTPPSERCLVPWAPVRPGTVAPSMPPPTGPSSRPDAPCPSAHCACATDVSATE